jgi:hypothetical protein
MKQLYCSSKVTYSVAGLSLLALVAIIPIASRAQDEAVRSRAAGAP